MSEKCWKCENPVVDEKDYSHWTYSYECKECNEESEKHTEIIDIWNDEFRKAGFGDYDLDLSNVSSRLIQMLGETCKKYNEEEK